MEYSILKDVNKKNLEAYLVNRPQRKYFWQENPG